MNIINAKRYISSKLNLEEAKSIIEYVTGIDRKSLLTNGEVEITAFEQDKIDKIINKRENGYPLQYILGKWTFMDNEYFVGEGVLIPRDDTEVVVQSVIPYLKEIEKKAKISRNNNITEDSAPRIIDLCSGSGIIPVTLKRMFSDFQVHALELSQRALPYLKKNIESLAPDIILHSGDLNELYRNFSDGYFDLIISNPPYIRHDQLSLLQKEVQEEPKIALDGGNDGLIFYRNILDKWSSKLKNRGMIAFELGENQFEAVKSLMENKNFCNINSYKDLGNTQRAINGTLLYK